MQPKLRVLVVLGLLAGVFALQLGTTTAQESDVESVVSQIRDAAYVFTDADADYQAMLEMVGDAEIVLIGEATHGTHEFYAARAKLTQYLIEQKGFMAVAVEADWAHAFAVNDLNPASSIDALAGFRERFPLWMWRNADVLRFVEWLHRYNVERPETPARFYGLDLYGIDASMNEVLEYLHSVDAAAAERARTRYACFEGLSDDPQVYGLTVRGEPERSCAEEAETQLQEILQHDIERMSPEEHHAYLNALENARVVKNGEAFYRTLYQGTESTWNLRDRHMMDSLNSLVGFLEHQYGDAKIVVWAHNSHVGDARATEMGQRGEFNIGQLARERYGERAVLIGFSTYTGTVTAASEWDAPAELKQVLPALPESYEALFHSVGIPCFFLDLRGDVATAVSQERLERAIGVLYLPETERFSHYFNAILSQQFDIVIHMDVTHAVEPLDPTTTWSGQHVPEGFPTCTTKHKF
jgi:erythromycin esterase-like protein